MLPRSYDRIPIFKNWYLCGGNGSVFLWEWSSTFKKPSEPSRAISKDLIRKFESIGCVYDGFNTRGGERYVSNLYLTNYGIGCAI